MKVRKVLKPKRNLITIQNDLHEIQRKNAIHKGASPWGVDTEIMDRLSPAAEEDWDRVKQRFTRFRANVRARYMNSDYGSDPLLVLEVQPLGGNFPTTTSKLGNTLAHFSRLLQPWKCT